MAKARTSRQDRLYRRVAEKPKKCPFELLKSLLEAYEYTPRKRTSGSSHVVFKRSGTNPICVPYRRPAVKEHYVREVLEAIDEIERQQAAEIGESLLEPTDNTKS